MKIIAMVYFSLIVIIPSRFLARRFRPARISSQKLSDEHWKSYSRREHFSR
jgi:hypothetical protein